MIHMLMTFYHIFTLSKHIIVQQWY